MGMGVEVDVRRRVEKALAVDVEELTQRLKNERDAAGGAAEPSRDAVRTVEGTVRRRTKAMMGSGQSGGTGKTNAAE
jgi:hypothetical protein